MFVRKTPNPFARDAALCNLMSGHGVTLVVKGSVCPKTDGTIIWVPPLPLGADEIDREIHDHSVSHEPAHVTEGSFDVDAKGVGQFLHSIWNFIEDARVEYSQERTKYPGLKVWRGEMLAEFSKYQYRMGTSNMLCAKGGEMVVEGGLCTLLLEARGVQLGVKPGYKSSPEVRGFYAKNLSRWLDEVVDLADCAAAFSLAKRIFRQLVGDLRSGEAKVPKKKPKNKNSGDGAGEEYEDDVKRLIDDLNSRPTPTPADRALFVSAQGSAQGYKPNELTRLDKAPRCTSEAAAQMERDGRVLLGPHGARMTHMFVTNSRPRTVHGKLDGRLDLRAVTNDHFDTRRDLYNVRVRGATDRAAMSFLMDVSASMSQEITTLDEIVMGIGYYLDRARVPFDIHGFGTYYHTIKEFEEPWRGEARERMIVSGLDGNTHTAWAVEQAARGLMARTEGRKVLAVMTDGNPADPNKEIPYVRRMCKALRSHGATVIGIGLGVNLSRMFGADFIQLPVGDGLGKYLVARIGEILNRKGRVR